MPFDTQILLKKVENFKKVLEQGKFGDVLVTALNTGSGAMQQRIFTDNTDVKGNDFGQYVGAKKQLSDRSQLRALFGTTSKTDKKRIKASAGLALTSYQRKRANKGRQVLRKDLELTGGLRRSIETQIESEKAVVLQFNNDEAAKIARGQEQQITNIRNGRSGTTKGTGATKIFSINDKERERIVEEGIELIKQIFKP